MSAGLVAGATLAWEATGSVSGLAPLALAPLADEPLSDAGDGQLLVAALLGIATVVVLITWAKFHPFLALILGTAVMGGVAAVPPDDIVTSFTKGLGSTTGSVGLLIALGAMIGKLLADSGGADTIVGRLIDGVTPQRLPWAMALIAAILGIPLFFEVGVVLLVPVVILVARRLDISLMKVGIPALAGLSILHGFVPPHPGPLVAIDALEADLGTVLIYGLIIAVPTLVVSGPLLAQLVDRWVPVHAHAAPGGDIGMPDDRPGLEGADATDPDSAGGSGGRGDSAVQGGLRRSRATSTVTAPAATSPASAPAPARRRPGFGAALLCMTLPVLLMLARAVAELTMPEESRVRTFLEFLGTPAVALVLAVLVAMALLGFGSGMDRKGV
jgi:GntP family gluconate:H+ symporter